MAAAAGVRLDRDGLVTVLTIDRPEARNAIARATMQELAGAISEVEASPARVLVVTGAGNRVFVAGGDLKELASIRTHEEATAMADTMRRVLDRLATLPVPVVAAVNGDAYGGGAEVAVACDIRIAADDVRCAFNQVALGIMPAWGGIERLTALLGRGRALALMTTGRVLDAEAALALGLFDEVVPRAAFDQQWRDVAAQIACAPTRCPRRHQGRATGRLPHRAPRPRRTRDCVLREHVGRRRPLADGRGGRPTPPRRPRRVKGGEMARQRYKSLPITPGSC